MKTLTLCIIFLSMISVFPTFAQAQEYVSKSSWFQSYQDMKRYIKPLLPNEKHQCEKLLKEILNDLDTKNNCNVDAECSLINQLPFGSTVPVRSEEAKALKLKMNKFRESCDNGYSHSVNDNDIINVPVCWKSKCLVKTSLKKK